MGSRGLVSAQQTYTHIQASCRLCTWSPSLLLPPALLPSCWLVGTPPWCTELLPPQELLTLLPTPLPTPSPTQLPTLLPTLLLLLLVLTTWPRSPPTTSTTPLLMTTLPPTSRLPSPLMVWESRLAPTPWLSLTEGPRLSTTAPTMLMATLLMLAMKVFPNTPL